MVFHFKIIDSVSIIRSLTLNDLTYETSDNSKILSFLISKFSPFYFYHYFENMRPLSTSKYSILANSVALMVRSLPLSVMSDHDVLCNVRTFLLHIQHHCLNLKWSQCLCFAWLAFLKLSLAGYWGQAPCWTTHPFQRFLIYTNYFPVIVGVTSATHTVLFYVNLFSYSRWICFDDLIPTVCSAFFQSTQLVSAS